MKKSTLPQLLLLIVTLLGSLIGFFVRRAQLANELLSDGSLAPGSYLHIVLTVLRSCCWRRFLRFCCRCGG